MARRDSIGKFLPCRGTVVAGIAGEAKLDHLRLMSLGMCYWQDIEQYGLRIWFTDPDTEYFACCGGRELNRLTGSDASAV